MAVDNRLGLITLPTLKNYGVAFGPKQLQKSENYEQQND